ncbi:hypothetical protein HYH03_006314 [Edaphochlamys debaryana]|uniref:Uncharacterized protein n=1 Tax=Edaphochlamys debaryana TaxID=47281 RepID=A0A836C1N8_9CHLO|nr:hypothetical protein HYH03_006314 [Edaphochlamys debaryana]|eukprot:KAG2495714.1 hypothetical protein HYH03_006314 [Edaphochlamys debaryana]
MPPRAAARGRASAPTPRERAERTLKDLSAQALRARNGSACTLSSTQLESAADAVHEFKSLPAGAWEALTGEDQAGLVALFGLALRRSAGGAAGSPAAYATLRAKLALQLPVFDFADAITPPDLKLSFALVKSGMLSAYAALMHPLSALLARPHASRRVIEAGRELLAEFDHVMMHVSDLVYLATGPQASALNEAVAEALDAGVLEHWARLVLALASCEGGEASAANFSEATSHSLRRLHAAHGPGVYAGPSLSYLLSSHLTLLAASLDAGPTYGLVFPSAASRSASASASGSGDGEERLLSPVVPLTWHREDPSRRPQAGPALRAPKLDVSQAAVLVWGSALAELGVVLGADPAEARRMPLWPPASFARQALRHRLRRLDGLIGALKGASEAPQGQAAGQGAAAPQAQVAAGEGAAAPQAQQGQGEQQAAAAGGAQPAPAAPAAPLPPAAAAAPQHSPAEAGPFLEALNRRRVGCEKLLERLPTCPLLHPAPAFELGMRLAHVACGTMGLEGMADMHRPHHWRDVPGEAGPGPSGAAPRPSARLRSADVLALGPAAGMQLARAALGPLLAVYGGPGSGREPGAERPCPDWVWRRLWAWWVAVVVWAQPQMVAPQPSTLELLKLMHTPSERLPAQPSLDVAAALSANYLLALERMVRAPGAVGNPAVLDLFPQSHGRFGVWAELLAFAQVRDSASLVASVAKLLRKSAGDALAGPAEQLNQAGGLLLGCAQLAAQAFGLGLSGGLTRALVVDSAAPGAGAGPGGVGGDGAAGGSADGAVAVGGGEEGGAPVPEGLIATASFIAARLLPVAGAALAGLLLAEAVAAAEGPARGGPSAAAAGAGELTVLEKTRRGAVALLSSLLVSWLPTLLAAAQAEGPMPESDQMDEAGGWWGVLVRDVCYDLVLGAALQSLQREDWTAEVGGDGAALKAALWALLVREPALVSAAVLKGEAASGPGAIARAGLRKMFGPAGRSPAPELLNAVEQACVWAGLHELEGAAAGPSVPAAASLLYELAPEDARRYKARTSLLLPHAQALALLPLCANRRCVRLEGTRESAAALDPAKGGCCSHACWRELMFPTAAASDSADGGSAAGGDAGAANAAAAASRAQGSPEAPAAGSGAGSGAGAGRAAPALQPLPDHMKDFMMRMLNGSGQGGRFTELPPDVASQIMAALPDHLGELMGPHPPGQAQGRGQKGQAKKR